jgi:hypothetical protein
MTDPSPIIESIITALSAGKIATIAAGQKWDLPAIRASLRPVVEQHLMPKPKAKPATRKPDRMPDEEWIASLMNEPHLKGVNIPKEIAACSFWCKNNKAQPSRRRILNWLSKAERIVDLKAAGAQFATGLKLPAPEGPKGWHDWLKVELSMMTEEADGYSQLTAAWNCHKFTMMPASWQTRAINQLKQHQSA